MLVFYNHILHTIRMLQRQQSSSAAFCMRITYEYYIYVKFYRR